MKLCIFGGSFDPIHEGHIQIAKSALEQFNFDQLYFVPAFLSPFKSESMFSPEERVQKIRQAIEPLKDPRIQISDLEIKRTEKSYTIDTVKEFHQKFPKSELYLLMGADAFKDFFKWKQPEEILRLTQLVLAKRSDIKIDIPKQFISRIHALNMKEIEVSSTELRNKLAKS